MNLYDLIISEYPELQPKDFEMFGAIRLQDDSDGQGVYIAKWDYEKPIPAGLKLGK